MKKITLIVVATLLLGACSEADMKMVSEEIAKGLKQTKLTKAGRSNYKRTKARAVTSSNIMVVNSKSPECRGITLHKAMIYQSPYKYNGKVIASIPVHRVIISNSGKRRKVVFDISYTKSYGNRKYGTFQQRSGVKEHAPLVLRSHDMNAIYNIGGATKAEKYTKIEVVDCM